MIETKQNYHRKVSGKMRSYCMNTIQKSIYMNLWFLYKTPPAGAHKLARWSWNRRKKGITWPYGLSTRLTVFCYVHTSIINRVFSAPKLKGTKLEVWILNAHHDKKKKIMKWPLFIRGGHAFSFLRVSPLQVTLSPIWGRIVFLPRRECE